MKNKLLIILSLVSQTANGQIYNVGERSMDLYDSVRSRRINTEIWYPASEIDENHEKITDLPFVLDPTIRNAEFIKLRCPVIFLSHGTGGNRFSLAWLAIYLAQNGYIAIAPDHWGNTYDNKIPEYFVRYWERPLDVSFLLTTFLADKELAKYIDTDKIGIVGFSFGGYTSLALAGADLDCNLLKKNAQTSVGKKEFNIPELGDLRKLIEKIPCESVNKTFKDNRIKAIVALSPALGCGFFSQEQTKSIGSPVLIIGAENDRIAPIQTNAEIYSKLIPGAEYIILKGKIGHYIFLNEANASLKKEAKKYYSDDSTIDRNTVHKEVESYVISFLNKSLKK
jgi:predicted dienelactone hydrolase